MCWSQWCELEDAFLGRCNALATFLQMFVLVSAGAITGFRQKAERGHVGEFCESVLVLASWLFWAYYFSTSCGFYSG